MELLIYRFIRLHVISVRYFCLMFFLILYGLPKKYQRKSNCIHLSMSLFIILLLAKFCQTFGKGVSENLYYIIPNTTLKIDRLKHPVMDTHFISVLFLLQCFYISSNKCVWGTNWPCYNSGNFSIRLWGR